MAVFEAENNIVHDLISNEKKSSLDGLTAAHKYPEVISKAVILRSAEYDGEIMQALIKM